MVCQVFLLYSTPNFYVFYGKKAISFIKCQGFCIGGSDFQPEHLPRGKGHQGMQHTLPCSRLHRCDGADGIIRQPADAKRRSVPMDKIGTG